MNHTKQRIMLGIGALSLLAGCSSDRLGTTMPTEAVQPTAIVAVGPTLEEQTSIYSTAIAKVASQIPTATPQVFTPEATSTALTSTPTPYILAASTPTPQPAFTSVNSPTAEAEEITPVPCIEVVVESGNTTGEFYRQYAEVYPITWEEYLALFRQYNRDVTDPNKIQVGQRLCLPGYGMGGPEEATSTPMLSPSPTVVLPTGKAITVTPAATEIQVRAGPGVVTLEDIAKSEPYQMILPFPNGTVYSDSNLVAWGKDASGQDITIPGKEYDVPQGTPILAPFSGTIIYPRIGPQGALYGGGIAFYLSTKGTSGYTLQGYLFLGEFGDDVAGGNPELRKPYNVTIGDMIARAGEELPSLAQRMPGSNFAMDLVKQPGNFFQDLQDNKFWVGGAPSYLEGTEKLLSN